MAGEIRRVERRRPKPASDDAAQGQPPPKDQPAPNEAVTASADSGASTATAAPLAADGPVLAANGAAPPRGAGKTRPNTRVLVGTEGERTVHPGVHAGDRAVRIVRPRLEGVQVEAPGFVRVERSPEPHGALARGWHSAKRFLIGTPIRSAQEGHERLNKVAGLAVFATDNVSSSAYATEEIMRVLVLAGVGALWLTMPLTIGIVVLLAIVAISYQQTIRAYPGGGGSYKVASENLGAVAGLIAGAALLIDYVLTVAVSTSAGVAAITSAFPALYAERVLICVGAIALITLGNLRGIRETGSLFAGPLYVYIIGLLGVIAYGVFRWATGTLPPYEPPAHAVEEVAQTTQALTLFLILRAFSSGSVALTGVEAVSNGVPAFKPPEPRNASITLAWMAGIFATIFLGMSFLAGQLHIVPDPAEVETVVSQLTKTLVGKGWYYYVVQFSTTLLLILAANTSFNGFPRLASIMAKDKFLPSHFAFRGERLAFTNGIVVLAVIAALLVWGFQGSVTGLIPLYTVGVFIAFTLSQAGMVRHWWHLRERGWRVSMAVNATGATATAVVALVVGITKFALGAWVVLVLIPIIVVMLLGVRRHYRGAHDQLVLTERDLHTRPDLDPAQLQHTIVIPVADLNLATMRAIAYAESLTGVVDHPDEMSRAHIIAVHVTDDVGEGEELKERWQRTNPGVDLVILESPYRALVGPLLTYINALEKQRAEGTSIVTVLLPEYIPAHWWEHILHTQTALRLKASLLFRPRTAVASVPYHLAS